MCKSNKDKVEPVIHGAKCEPLRNTPFSSKAVWCPHLLMAWKGPALLLSESSILIDFSR